MDLEEFVLISWSGFSNKWRYRLGMVKFVFDSDWSSYDDGDEMNEFWWWWDRLVMLMIFVLKICFGSDLERRSVYDGAPLLICKKCIFRPKLKTHYVFKIAFKCELNFVIWLLQSKRVTLIERSNFWFPYQN